MSSPQFLVDLSRQSFSFQCALLTPLPDGRLAIVGRGMRLRVTITANKGHLNEAYVMDFREMKRNVEKMCKGFTEKVILAKNSQDYTVKCIGKNVRIESKAGELFVFPAKEVELIDVQETNAEELSRFLCLSLVSASGGDARMKELGIHTLTLYANDQEHTVGYHHTFPVSRL